MAKNNNSTTNFDNMKFDAARQVGVNLKQGYNGDLPAKEAGKVGGRITQMVFESFTGKKY